MFKTQVYLSLVLITFITGCATAPDYQSLANCSDFSRTHAEPADDQEFALFVGKRYNLSGLYEKWFPVITHVDCNPVADLWEETRLSPGMHSVRLRLNPEALGEESGFGYGGGIMGAGIASKHSSDMDNAAQSFELTVEAGKQYFGYAKVLALGDVSFWVVDESGNIVVKSLNFQPKWQEQVVKNNKKLETNN